MDSATLPEILRRLAFDQGLDPPRLLEDIGGALREQLVRRTNAERASLVARAMDHGAHHAAAVERDDSGDEFELVVAHWRGQRSDGRLAPTSEGIDDAPFGVERLGGHTVGDRFDRAPHGVVARADLDRDNPLAWRRY